MSGWQRTERWLARLSAVAALAAVIGWLASVATGSGWWSAILLLITIAIGPACYAYVTLDGSLAHVAGLLTLVAIALAGMTVVRRYEMAPVGR